MDATSERSSKKEGRGMQGITAKVNQSKERAATSFTVSSAKRPAVKRPDEIIASCPINCVCSSLVEGSKRWSTCGWYRGLFAGPRGLSAMCDLVEDAGA